MLKHKLLAIISHFFHRCSTNIEIPHDDWRRVQETICCSSCVTLTLKCHDILLKDFGLPRPFIYYSSSLKIDFCPTYHKTIFKRVIGQYTFYKPIKIDPNSRYLYAFERTIIFAGVISIVFSF